MPTQLVACSPACDQTDSQQALVLISFNPQAVETEVSLPLEVTGLVRDAFSGERIDGTTPLHIAMGPYQTRVLASE